MAGVEEGIAGGQGGGVADGLDERGAEGVVDGGPVDVDAAADAEIEDDEAGENDPGGGEEEFNAWRDQV